MKLLSTEVGVLNKEIERRDGEKLRSDAVENPQNLCIFLAIWDSTIYEHVHIDSGK